METQRAIIIGSGVVSLGVINDLASEGVLITHISTKPDDLALRSRWTQEAIVLDASDNQSDQLIDILLANTTKWRGACVLPTTDPMLRAISKNLERIGRSYVTPVMPWKQLRKVVNKGLLYATAAKASIPTPRVCYGAELSNANEWIKSLDFPVIIKPSETPAFFAHFRSKVLLANAEDELWSYLDDVNRLQLDVMISEIIPGTQSDLKAYRCYIDRTGQVVAEMCSEKIRSHPPEFGVGIVQRTIPMNEILREQGLRLLRELKFTGFATVEFKYDSRDDAFKLMEINPRPAMIQRMFRKAGINFAKLTIDDLTGEPVNAQYSYAPNVYAIHNSADLYHLRRYAKRGLRGLMQYFRPYFQIRKVLLLPPIRDPGPFFYDLRRIIAGRLRNRTQRSDAPTRFS